MVGVEGDGDGADMEAIAGEVAGGSGASEATAQPARANDPTRASATVETEGACGRTFSRTFGRTFSRIRGDRTASGYVGPGATPRRPSGSGGTREIIAGRWWTVEESGVQWRLRE